MRIRTFTAATMLALGLGVTINAPAQAEQYPWPHNGCTNAPDRIGAANFTHACNQHDGCYANHWANRGTCDGWFWNDMIAECRTLQFELVSSCAGHAVIYYSAVRAFGQAYYDSNGKMVRIDTPMSLG